MHALAYVKRERVGDVIERINNFVKQTDNASSILNITL